MTMISAATIHVQIIELVTGNPKTVNSTGGAAGTSSAPDSASAAGVPPAAEAPAAGAAGPADWRRRRLRIQARRQNRGEERTGKNDYAESLHLNKSLQTTRIALWSIRIAGLKDWKDCLVVKKFTSNF